MLPNKRLSYSSVYLLMGCPKRWQAHYLGIDGQQFRDPPNVWTARGTAVHAGLEYHLLQKINLRTQGVGDLSFAPAMQAAKDAWLKESRSEGFNWVGRTEEQTLDEVEQMLEAALRELAPTVNPNIVEWDLEVPIPGTDGWTFLARMDVIGDDDRGKGQWIYDWKTGKPWLKAKADLSQQFTAYGWAFRQFSGEAPTGFSILSITPPAKNAPVVCEEVITKRHDSQYDHWEEILQGVVKQIEGGAFWPNSSYEWCHRCPLSSTCTPWKG